MKNIVTLLICLGSFCAVSQNPISPPGVYIADPTARVWNDGNIYIYGSLDESPDYYCSHNMYMLSSNDMKKWTLHKDIFSSKGPNDKILYSEGALYAPDCMYDKSSKQYCLFYCLSTGEEGVAFSDKAIGPFENSYPIKGLNQIDPAVFIDDDGEIYYYWGQFSAKGAKLNKDMKTIDFSTFKENLVTESEHGFHEGVWVTKNNNKYYMVYTQISPRGEATAIGYSISDSPLGPFEYGGIIIDNYGCDPETWNNHGSLTKYNDKWYIFYHRSTHGSRTMRKACVEPVEFLPDGSIPQVEMTTQGASDPLNPFEQIDAARAGLLYGKVRIVKSSENSEELARIENSNSATYKYFNFYSKPTKVIFNICAQSGGEIQLFTNNFSGPQNAQIKIYPGDGKTYKEYVADINHIKEGVSPIFLKFLGENDKDLFKIDSFRFE